jgi:hypothetical protein
MKKKTAWRDPIVEEIRQHWDKYAKTFDYDLEKICLDLRRRQEERGGTVVSFSGEGVDNDLIHRRSSR